MNSIIERAYANLPKFLQYRGIDVPNLVSGEQFMKDLLSKDTRYGRIEGKYTETDKLIHILIISGLSTALNNNLAIQKILAQSGNRDICIFYQGQINTKTIINFQIKNPVHKIEAHPIGKLAIVHPELSSAPKYELVDGKTLESEVGLKPSELKATISQLDPPMIWYNWPVGSVVKITSQADAPGLRVGYRIIKN